MFAKKKNSSVLIIAALAIIVAAGGMYFISTQSKDGSAAPEMAAAPETTGDVETAAGEEGTQKQTPSEAEQAAAAAGPNFNGTIVEPGNPVVAKVDGKDITRVDVYRYIKAMPENIQQMPAAQVYPMALEQVINARLIQNKAEEANIESDAEVQQQLELAKQQIERGIYIQRTVDAKITEGKLKKAYKEYVDGLPDVEERHARHILVDSEDKAKDIVAQLKDGGDFAELAKANSIDPVAAQGGDLGWFAKADMVPEFAEAAFSIKKGEFSAAPIKTEFGWHIIKIEDVRQRPAPDFEEVKPYIQVQLRREILDDMLGNWRDKAEIETFDINGNPIEPAAGGDATEAKPSESN